VHCAQLGKETEADGEQFLHGADFAAVDKEQDHVVVAFDQQVVVRDEHTLAANDRTDGYALGQAISSMRRPTTFDE
jgi:hypothetical protein